MKQLRVLMLWGCYVLMLNGRAKASNAEHSLIPYPNHLENLSGEAIQLSEESKIYYSNGVLKKDAEYLQNILNLSTGYNFSISKKLKKATKGDVVLRLEEAKSMNSEGYSLNSGKGYVEIVAQQASGVFYGIQTLLQLLPVEVYSNCVVKNIKWTVPLVKIKDEPDFEWRGMHLDVARHFFSVDFVMRFIDAMAYHKLNAFHWHLTDDQGWRIEIKKYPLLTEVGAWRDSTIIGHYKDKPRRYEKKREGGFYTQKEIKEVVKYAHERHITIVPEIEMPGHAQAAVTAYPEFGCTGKAPGVRPIWGISQDIYSPEEKTIEFLKNVLDEVLELFPGEYIHIGGDEAHKNQWEASERIQQLRKERGLKNMHEMQSWFITQIDNYLTEKGRKLIGWDEILQGGLAEGAAVMAWRGDKGGIAAAKMHHKVVMATNQYTYFDHYQSKDKANEPLAIGGFLPLEKVYQFNPIPRALNAKEANYVMGAQAQLWSEYIGTENQMEYMAFPRMCALSDVIWSNKSDRDYDAFIKALNVHLKRFDKLNINYRIPEELK